MSSQKFPIDLKFQRFSLPSSSDVPIDELLQILYDGIRNIAGDYLITPPVPFPVSTAGGGAGGIGTGVVNYVYRLREGMCRLDVSIQFGVGTFPGPGAGAIQIQMPVEAVGVAGPLAPSGTAVVYNAAGGGLFTGTAIVALPGPFIIIHLPQIPGVLTPVVPGVFAAGDSINISIDYPYVI